jgi:hypothetical protein
MARRVFSKKKSKEGKMYMYRWWWEEVSGG